MLAGGGVGGVCGSRISLRLRECDRRRHSLGFYSTIARLSSCSWPLNFIPCSNRLNPPTLSSSSSDSVASSDSPILSTCCFRSSRPEIDPLDECQLGKTFFGQEEDDRDVPSEGLSSVAGGVVALGKFDALHIGHRELAIQASKVGPPFLLSFVGMAEVLGWEPRPPIVAKCDRKRVLSSWAPYCGNMAPAEFQIEFSIVRHLSPREFVIKLSKDLGVRGVVAGENYRFGYKAAGDATELVRLCKEYGIGAYIINSVMDRNKLSMDIYSSNSKDRGQVSSTRVRRGLAVGDMKYVSELLGRRHRLILKAKNEEVFTCDNHKLSAPKSCLLNLAPKEGLYEKCYIFVGEELVQCRVVIDTGYIHIELDDVSASSNFGTQDLKLLRIEFGYSLS